ncbi:glutathione S-transferase N-terminal domain-containing protein [archaeon]|nr:glutathione S-transferase N-terminal domain-containing protein [archaeon]
MNVIVYSTPTCPWCIRVKDFLKENAVEFKEVDVSADQTAAQEMVKKSGQMGVPVVEVDGNVVVGFDEMRLRQLLSI